MVDLRRKHPQSYQCAPRKLLVDSTSPGSSGTSNVCVLPDLVPVHVAALEVAGGDAALQLGPAVQHPGVPHGDHLARGQLL